MADSYLKRRGVHFFRPSSSLVFSGPATLATVISDVWPELFFFTLVATIVVLVDRLTATKLAVNSQLLTVLGVLLGLVISFRTSSAYERYSEGRKLWSSVCVLCRSIAQLIWTQVSAERPNAENPELAVPLLNGTIEKKSMINLLQAVAVAVKHMLRNEAGIYYEDLYPLIAFLPRYAYAADGTDAQDLLPLWQASHDKTVAPLKRVETRTLSRTTTLDDVDIRTWSMSYRPRGYHEFDPEKVLPVVYTDHPLRPSQLPPKTSFFDYFPILRPIKRLRKIFKPKKVEIHEDERFIESDPHGGRVYLGRKKQEPLDSNVPLQIMLYISSYNAFLLKNGLLTAPVSATLASSTSALQDAISGLDRIKTTPLPFAYQAHLRLTVWLYLFFLPFQILGNMGYLTIVATAFASFLLLGFLEIGQEIENPFDYGLNDLDLDGFCLTLQRELHEITAHPNFAPSEFCYSSWNQPFAPSDRRTAEEMIHDEKNGYHDKGTGLDNIKKTLLHSWRQVDQETRL
ncbi:UPF0187-domain-containing protein [Thelephora ganbajun]|uniref:UPF0187-domain-containing protein n=1 Tax=Thelephora ganbajun TaxID=370292 RepID=A0ACB6ZTD9_THEGA|nr:UPF0187-domain-containing protein [Thelephora ganbajun]